MTTDVADMLDRARESLNRNLIALDDASAKVIAELAGAEEYNDKLGSHLAWITSKVAEVTSALRQLEKHDRTMSKTPEQRFKLVGIYLRTEATPAQRRDIMQLLTDLDGARVVS